MIAALLLEASEFLLPEPLLADPFSEDALYQEGIKLYREGKKKLALRKFTEAARVNPYESRKILDFIIGNADFEFGLEFLQKAGKTAEHLYPARSGIIYLNTGKKEKAFYLLFESLRYSRTLSDSEMFYSQFKGFLPSKIPQPQSLAQAYALALLLDEKGNSTDGAWVLARFTFPFRFNEVTSRLKAMRKFELLKQFLKIYAETRSGTERDRALKQLKTLERMFHESPTKNLSLKEPRKILGDFENPLYPEAVIVTAANTTHDPDFLKSTIIVTGELQTENLTEENQTELYLYLKGIKHKDREALMRFLKKFPKSPLAPLARLKLREIRKNQ